MNLLFSIIAIVLSAPFPFLLQGQEEETSNDPAATPSTPADQANWQAITSAKNGPWGDLEYFPVALDCPVELLPLLSIPSLKTEWIFPAANREELNAILHQSDLPSDKISAILYGSTIVQTQDYSRIYPTDETILNMPIEARQKFYSLLSRFPENKFFYRPLYIGSDNLSRWFQGTEIPRQTISDISKLAYPTPSGVGYFLSDLAYALKGASDSIEERAVYQGLLRRRALIVRLRLTEGTDITQIAKYWTAGYKNKSVLPFLESAVSADSGGAIDVAHLLPATPRQYVNRFPDLANGITGRYPDWFWTCYNFFRFSPRDVYADSGERANLMDREFDLALPPYEYGDMIVFNSGGRAIHGCIYIAEDIVFTKNGSDMFTPWCLMKIQDVVAYHDIKGDITLTLFRKRPLPPTVPAQ
ncbi:MAG: hypothetical protein KA250_11700 [Verrucomicrobiales bacterium]|jgi:hypothetical protein|nr:hypothetical protein [Verrucomicrobiales bacterium]MBP9225792.1 hypothetical protein [Verrucomicrobiales bacterium]